MLSVKLVPLGLDDDVNKPLSSPDSSSLPIDVFLLLEEKDPFLLGDPCPLPRERRLQPDEMSPSFDKLKSIASS